MSDQRADNDSTPRSAAKEPEQWVTGGEPMTGPQESYLQTLAREPARGVW